MNKLANLTDTFRNLFLYNIYRLNKRNKTIWAFGEWFGEKCNDNSMYLANYVVANYDVQVYWICKENCDTTALDPRIVVINMGSAESKKIIRTAKVFVMNQNFHDFSENGFNYFGGAVAINLWHGVMWKRLGNSIDDKNRIVKLYYQLYYKAHYPKYWLSVSKDYTEVIKEAFGTKEGNFIRSGYPRNSIFYSAEQIGIISKKIRNKLNSQYDIPEDAYLITYMPTFRDKDQRVFNIETLLEDRTFREFLINNNVYVIQKAHFVTLERNENESNHLLQHVITFNDVAAQELLAASDMLITDYSSCFFDYLLLDRPIIHFIYDYKYYKDDDRGLYYEWKEVNCGDVAFDNNQLMELIIENRENPDKQHLLREKRIKQYLTYESENSCREIADSILKLTK